MQYFICAIILVVVCIGSSLVDAFLSGSRLVVNQAKNNVAIEKSDVKKSGVVHGISW